MAALVVEDHDATRQLYVHALRARGHEVVAVADAAPAWDAFAARPFALVLLDLGLPTGDALELCRRMRAHPHGAGAVIVVVTADRDAERLQATLDAGADDYIAKPVDLPVLDIRCAIAENEWLRKHESHRAAEEIAARNQELRTLYRISEVTLSAASPDQAYADLLEEVCKSTGFPIAVIERYDEPRAQMVVTATRGIPPDTPLDSSAHESLSGRAARTRAPVIETHASAGRELAHPTLRGLGIGTWISFPLTVGGAVVGTLSLADTAAAPPDRRVVRWAGSLATGVAQFVDRISAEEERRESERRHRRLTEQLEQANEELERFAYSVSHDLRAPLRTMQGFAHALIQNFGDRLPAEALDYAQRIINSGQMSEALIRDLLAYSRLSFEQLELQPVDLGQVIEAARDQLEADVRDTGASIVVEEPLPTVHGQSTTLVQVFANLISNAIKFIPLGRSPEIRIRAEERGPAVRLWVEDNGIGVPPGQEERIFRVFERLAEGGGRPGTGIGLAIVRRGMERMGGRAGVEVRPGEGSSFWVELPSVQDSKRRPWGRKRRES